MQTFFEKCRLQIVFATMGKQLISINLQLFIILYIHSMNKMNSSCLIAHLLFVSTYIILIINRLILQHGIILVCFNKPQYI